MTEEIYGDVLFLINFSMDFLSLFITGKIMHLKMNKWRLLASATVGGVYGVASLFFPFDGVLLVLANVACAFMMCLAAFHRKKSMPATLVSCLLFYGVGMMLGGVMTAIYSRLGKYTGYISIGGSIATVFGDIPIWVFGLAAGAAALVTYICGRVTARKSTTESVGITVGFGERTAEARCLVDSGNLLAEPISGTPVIFLKSDVAERAFPPEILSTMREKGVCRSIEIMKKLRFVPSASVNGEGTVAAAVPDFCYIETAHGTQSKKALIAVDFSGCDFGGTDGIVPKILI